MAYAIRASCTGCAACAKVCPVGSVVMAVASKAATGGFVAAGGMA